MCIVIMLFVLVNVIGFSTQKDSQETFGRTFYIGVLKPYRQTDNVILTATSANRSGYVNVYAPQSGINSTASFTNSNKLDFNISYTVTQLEKMKIGHKGIRVTSNVDISLLVTTSLNGGNTDSRETFLALPNGMLSNSYIISSYNRTYWDSEFLLVATKDNTTVNVKNSKVSLVNKTIQMHSLDTYLFASGQDLSGTIVSSNKPIAVFSGHEATGVRCSYNHYMVEQLLPTKMFDREFVVPPLPPKSAYVIRVYASERNTSLHYFTSDRNESMLLPGPGAFAEILGGRNPTVISSDRPVQTMTYSVCYTYGSVNFGGSTMSIIPSTKQYDDSYLFTVPSVFSDTEHYIAIMAKHRDISNGLRIDGQQMPSSINEYNITTPVSTYFVYLYRVYAGAHKLEEINGRRFGALLYGYGRNKQEAYSHIIGLRRADCEEPTTPNNGYVTMLSSRTDLSKAVYACMHGYTLHGSATRTCDFSGQWSGTMPTCRETGCGYPALPENGHIERLNGTAYLSQAVYACTKGYVLVGDSARICNPSGYWSGSIPKCAKIDGSLTCLKCTDVYHTNLCSTITKCSQGQVCYVERFTTHEGEIRYNMGCSEAKQCETEHQSISKRSVNCVDCCTSDLCNHAGCGSPGLPIREQRGPLCYDCALTYNMSECHSITLCKPYEVCSIEKYDRGGLYDQYTTACKAAHCLSSKSGHSASNVVTRSTPVCQQCCDTDFCNSNCNSIVGTGNGVSIIG